MAGPCGYPYDDPPGPGGGGGAGVPPCVSAAPGAPGASIAGATAVGGSRLPPFIRAVLASGSPAGGGAGSSEPLSGGAKTVAGSGTERSSPASALVSVPVQGVAPAGGGATGPPGAPDAGPVGTPGCVRGSPLPGTPACVRGSPLPGTPACVRGSEGSGAAAPAAAPADTPAPVPAPAAPPPDSPRSPMPSLSAASCNHSGGDNKNDV
ncbi:hypothetical protein AQJ64_31020 [Streptomyces griseoruber]|uniref:Uncharacterized protein n=1 Tax=Streptomyces griseoruber TaxID=1943 RepID=A0A117R9G0_9ACTN|nr:hypothetical protein AQJ64_31020 [Streptomyces griseoruber]